MTEVGSSPDQKPFGILQLPVMVVPTCNLSIWGDGGRRIASSCQAGIHRETLSGSKQYNKIPHGQVYFTVTNTGELGTA